MNNKKSYFSIVHVNIRGFRANWQSFMEFIESVDFPDVITINETKVNQNVDAQLPNYHCASRRDSYHGHHGSAIFVKHGICDVHEIISLREQFPEEVIGIRINGKNSHPAVNICTYYNPPGNQVNSNIFRHCSKLKGATYITGDFNCKNAAWGSTRDDIQGDHLLQTINANSFAILNDGNMTRYDPVHGTEQALDLMVCNFAALSYFNKFTVGPDVGSDHFPIISELNLSSYAVNKKVRNWKKANWEIFRESLKTFQNTSTVSAEDIDSVIGSLTTAITKAIDSACPFVSARFSKSSNFTPEMLQIVKEKRALRRQKCCAAKNGDRLEVIRLQQIINKKTKELKKLQLHRRREDLTRKCQELNSCKDSAKFFRLFDALTQSRGTKPQSSTLKRDDGSKVMCDKDKSELFATHLEKCHQISDYQGFNSSWRNTVEKYVNERTMSFKVNKNHSYAEIEPGDDDPLVGQIHVEEILESLKKCKNKSAPGEDMITYQMLKKVPKNIHVILSSIFTTCLRIGYFPDVWKKASVSMLPKPGKDSTIVKNYRPISLISCVGKVFERIVANRLSSYMERKKLFSPYQSGFRKGRMTAEQLLRLIEESSISIKKRQITAALFLDAEAAFDQAWQDGIRYKLHNQLKLPQRLVRLLSSFLTNRSLTVKVGNEMSRPIEMAAGTPQGSCLSPLLYIILVNDIPGEVTEFGSLSQFADDIAVWSRAYTFKGATNKLQKSVNMLEGWCRRWRIKLNASKSQLILIHKQNEKRPDDLSIQLFDGIVSPCKTAKFLGLEIDERLTFKSHVSEKVQKANVRLNLFKMLSCAGVDNATLIRLYKTYIRPLIEYGCVATIAAKEETISKFQKVQNNFIRVCLNLPRYIRTDLLHEAACLERVKERLETLSKKNFSAIRGLNIIDDLCREYCDTIPFNTFKCPLDYLL